MRLLLVGNECYSIIKRPTFKRMVQKKFFCREKNIRPGGNRTPAEDPGRNLLPGGHLKKGIASGQIKRLSAGKPSRQQTNPFPQSGQTLQSQFPE